MKRTSKTLVMAAAMSGLIGGAVVQQSLADPTNTVTTNTAPGKLAAAKKAPKVHGCAGQNDCKGLGGCEAEAKKFKNACKGKGGCEITEKDIKTWQKMQKDAAAKAKAAGQNAPTH